jgi:two-component system, chemotaxis family, chemotaxis protein CheY
MDLRILVVDDSEATRRMITAVLGLRDWKVCGEAENGDIGIRKFRSLRPDAVIVDLAMPGISGIETARRMSRLDPFVPLILFTLTDVEELTHVARKAGIYATVSKDRALDLVTTIESAIADHMIFRSIDLDEGAGCRNAV